MLAAGSGGDSLQDEDDTLSLDNDEEMMLMRTKEAMGNTTPSLPPDDHEEEEPESFIMPPAKTGVDDSFESYIFDSDGDDDFQTRGKNHVIPVINSSPTKKTKADFSDNNTDPTTSPQSPSERSSTSSGSLVKGDSPPPQSADGHEDRLLGRSSSFGLYVSPPSSSDFESSPREADTKGMPQSAFGQYDLHGQRRHSFPVIQEPPDGIFTSPSGQSALPYTRQSAPPPTIPDGRMPIVLETPKYQQPSESSKTTEKRSFSSTGFLCGMGKPIFCIVIFYLLFMTGSFIYFVTQYVQIPSLREQVEQLSAEVDRLEQQVDELEALIVELNGTVTDLSLEIDELKVENDNLETQNAILEEANETFDDRLAELQDQNDVLQGTVNNLTLANEQLKERAFKLELLNSNLANQTLALNTTNIELTARVENLTAVNDGLEEANAALTNQTDELQTTLNELVLEFNAAYKTVVELQDETAMLQEENNRLDNLTESLGTILSFLEETNQNANVTVEQLAGQLEEQITNNRVLVLENLQNTLTQRTQTWNCDYINAFSGASFVQDYTVPIESGSYDAVMDYVESRVLNDLCLDRADFELYLSINFMPNGDGLTSNELISGVSMYSTAALDHYFPDSGEAGVTPEEWAEAEYDCANIPPERQYRSMI